jgi:peptidoglycan glycosyltransferase
VLDLPDTSADLPNHDDRACSPSGEVTMTEALAVSCNTAFAYLGMQIGADALQSQAAKFGFGDALSVPMRVTPSSVPAELNEPQLAQSAVGQYDVRVTPLQVAMFSAGVANRGIVMKPHLVRSVLSSDLSVIETSEPEQLSEAVTPEVAAQLTEMMEAVVEDGSGEPAQIDGVRVAGKTGTAEHDPDERAHAWFTGFAPAQDPPARDQKVACAGAIRGPGRRRCACECRAHMVERRACDAPVPARRLPGHELAAIDHQLDRAHRHSEQPCGFQGGAVVLRDIAGGH